MSGVAHVDTDTVSAVDELGYAVLRQVVDAELREALLASAERLLASSETRGRDRGADGKDGFRGMVTLEPGCLPLVATPRVLPSLIALLSPNIHLLSSHLISLPSLDASAPRTIRIPTRPGWHRDMYGVTDDLGHSQTPRLAVKCAYFLTPPGPDTGTTMFLPRSHLRTDPVIVPACQIDPPGAVTPEIGPGDAVLFENRTWHAGGLNTSGAPRIVLMLQYGYRWLACVDDPVDPRVVGGKLSDVERQLIGAPDRGPDGSLTKGAGAQPLRTWWKDLQAQETDFTAATIHGST